MLKRTLTGAVILLLTAGAIALRLISPLFFDLLVFVLAFGSLFEISGCMKKLNRPFFNFIVWPLPVAFWAIFKFSSLKLTFWALAILLVFVVSMVAELFFSKPDESENLKLLEKTKNTLFVAVYPLSLISSMFGLNYLEGGKAFVAIILAFGLSMITDTFAFIFGMLFGQKNGKKLAPAISPKKSIVGSIFGLFGGMVGGLVAWALFFKLNWFGAFGEMSTLISILLFVGVGAGCGIITQFGDLVESALKRSAGIKDMGNVFPGHGGFLDRIDGEMFSATLIFLVFMLI